MRPFLVRACAGGFVGVFALILLLYYVAPAVGVNFDWAAAVTSALGAVLWKVGMVGTFFMGMIVLPIVYTYLCFRFLPGSPAAKGVQYGVVLWLLTELFLMPMAGLGVFNSAHGGIGAVFMVLVAQVAYGAILGAIAGPASITGLLVNVSSEDKLTPIQHEPTEEWRRNRAA